MYPEILQEEHDDAGSANTRMAELKKKNPSAKYSVIQGRKSGKWHVVRHTSGGMSMAENMNTESFEDFLMEGIEVSHDEYIRSHGKSPRGSGNWQIGLGSKNPDVHSSKEGVTHISHNGSLSDAVKKAKAAAKKHGHTTVHVLP